MVFLLSVRNYTTTVYHILGVTCREIIKNLLDYCEEFYYNSKREEN